MGEASYSPERFITTKQVVGLGASDDILRLPLHCRAGATDGRATGGVVAIQPGAPDITPRIAVRKASASGACRGLTALLRDAVGT